MVRKGQKERKEILLCRKLDFITFSLDSKEFKWEQQSEIDLGKFLTKPSLSLFNSSHDSNTVKLQKQKCMVQT
jgi:hypothetical protein